MYETENPEHVIHFFSDTWHSPSTGTSVEIPGKGALSHRISAFLFSKLTQIGIPNHFLSTRNMRESLVQDSYALPFTLRVHSYPSPDLSKDFDMPEYTNFDPPWVEYITSSSKYHANDDFLMAMGWVDQDDIDEIHALAVRTSHGLQGLFAAWDLALIQMELTLARSFQDPFVVAGTLAPEQFLLKDLRTGHLWSMTPNPELESIPLSAYSLLARRLGVYTPRASTESELREQTTHDYEPSDLPVAGTPITDSPSTPSALNPKTLPNNVLLFPRTPS